MGNIEKEKYDLNFKQYLLKVFKKIETCDIIPSKCIEGVILCVKNFLKT